MGRVTDRVTLWVILGSVGRYMTAYDGTRRCWDVLECIGVYSSVLRWNYKNDIAKITKTIYDPCRQKERPA